MIKLVFLVGILFIFKYIFYILNKKYIFAHDKDTVKKVLVFGITDNYGGVESVIMNYYRNINHKILQFDFLCNTESVVFEEEIKKMGGNIFRIMARSKNVFKYYFQLIMFFRKNSYKYSAIWVNVCSLANIDYLIFSKIYGIPVRIIHAHNSQNMDSKLRGIIHKFNKLFIHNVATDYWSCSNQASLFFYNKKILNSKKYKMINNAIDLSKFKFSSQIREKYRKELELENKVVYLNIGRFHFQKNQLFLIDVFYEISKCQNNAILLIVGDGEDRKKISERIKELKLQDSVILMGIRNDISDLLNAVDFVIFPSLFEGLSLTLIESQASGLPLFVSNTCDIQSKISPEYHIIDLDKSPSYWANIILSSKIKYSRNSSIFHKRIKEKGFDIKTEVKKMENFFL